MSRSRHNPKQRQCGPRCTHCWPDGSYQLARTPTVDEAIDEVLYEEQPVEADEFSTDQDDLLALDADGWDDGNKTA